ncbi:rubredoxin [Mucilaginibacter yixingensis]|uniref:Rubredoxin n=1 Tax=Mucilaginibacter yixingensis TaxID=1295612 RepID=A0A2T5JBR5_9SPHI|nr:rubredoxin [Mucilaginibacter yixingensis]PTQ99211.1 rubredoxin [Mucilaginibacter yixingensis]
MSEHLIKVNLPGGFVSAGDLYELLLIAENAGATNVRFGNRQQLFFSIAADMLDDLDTDMLRAGVEYEVDADEYPNIISSYVCDSIFTHDSWLKEGLYRDIFDSFNYQPKLKINLIDRFQSFVPFFSGNFNFISSEVSNYWYLYVRFPKSNQFYCWPSLIYTEDIPVISKKIETVILKNKGLFYSTAHADEQLLYDMVSKGSDQHHQPVTQALQLPDFYLPYYEGFNRYANKYWLGVYRRNELFPIDFLKDVCNQCIRNRIGQIYTTPWKSILVKGIDPNHRNDWGSILDKYRLSVRHASNELNWQIEDICPEGLELKQQLVRIFEEADLRTYRLCFAIKTRPKTGLMGSVIIKTEPSGTYKIQHTDNFNPNSKTYITYRRRVKQDDLAGELMALCDSYYSISNKPDFAAVATSDKEAPAIAPKLIHQCRNCKTLYDSDYGDEFNNVAPGTAFEDLSDDYCCPVCDSGKECFEAIEAIAV